MVNFIRATVGKAHSKEGIGQTTHHTIGCTGAHHEKAQPAAHDDLIPERVADGHVPVHRHNGEKPRLSDPKEEEDVHLGHTSSKRDGSPLAENVHEHLGHCRGGVAHVQQGEDTDEEVHGCVEACVLVDEGDEEAVAHKDQQVKDQKEGEEQRIGPGVRGKAQQDEFCHSGLVEFLHCALPV